MTGRRQKIKQSITGFCETTTAHGVGRLAAHKDMLGRCIWVIFLLVTYCGFMYHIFTLVTRYIEAPVLTSFTKSNPFQFPDVYVCSGSRLSASKLVENLTDDEIDNLKFTRVCDSQCQENILRFGIRAVDPVPSTKLLSDAMESTEQAFVSEAYNKHYRNFTDCRFTLTGEEFTGDLDEFQAYPQSTRMECVAWNSVPAFLPAGNTRNYFQQVISQMNLPDDDRRCRSPKDFPLTEVAKFSKRQSLISIGCYRKVRNGTGGSQFTCPWPLKDVEDCVECCNTRSFTLTAVRGRTCYCIPSLSDFEQVDETSCDAACSPASEQNCGSARDDTVRSVYQVSQFPTPAKRLIYKVDAISKMRLCFHRPFKFPKDEGFSLCSACCTGFTHFIRHVPMQMVTGKEYEPFSTRCYCTNSGDFLKRDGESDPFALYTYAGGEVPTKAAIEVLYQSPLAAALQGPFCFSPIVGGIAASYCQVPYCQAPADLDCVSSKGGSPTTQAASAAYTGAADRTGNWNCEPWSSVRGGEHYLRNKVPFLQLTASKDSPAMFTIRLSDASDVKNASHRYCRAVESLHMQGSNVFGEHFLRPVCPVRTRQENYLDLSQCDVRTCYEKIPRVTAAVRNTVGHHLLAQQFGAELPHELFGCFFNNRYTPGTCSVSHFTSFVHPQMGLCHKFNKQHFPMSRDQSLMELNMQFFIDSTDSFGFSLPAADWMRDGVFKKMLESRMEADSEMQVILVPPGQFPWQSEAVRLDAGQHVVLELRLDRTVRLSRPPNATCLKDLGKISYNLTNWPANLRQSIHFKPSSNDKWSTDKSDDWRMKMEKLRKAISQQNALRLGAEMQFDQTQEDCINKVMLQRFESKCKCLPEFFPIPNSLSNLPRCLSSSNVTQLNEDATCLMWEINSLIQERQHIRSQCPPACDSSSFQLSQSTHPWPDLKPGQSLEFLEKLTDKYHAPFELRKYRGIGSLFFAHMRASQVETAGKKVNDEQRHQRLIKFGQLLQFVNSRLAAVTVRAMGPFGQEVKEEEAYPLKSLLAETGGTLGLWSGISVLTLCELIELIVHIVRVMRDRGDAADAAAAADGGGDGGEGDDEKMELKGNEEDRTERAQDV